MKRNHLFAMLIAASLLTACGIGKRAETMDSLLTEHAQMMRWGDVAAVVSFMDPEKQEIRPDEHYLARLANYRVTRYREVGRNQPDDDTVTQRFELRLVNVHTQAEYVVLHNTGWRWDEEAERWWMTTAMPELPGRG
jgi:hypothetical protein